MSSTIISAFFYSPEEREYILEILDPIAETDSFILGSIDFSQIGQLRERNILFDFQKDPSKSTSILLDGISKGLPGSKSIQLSPEETTAIPSSEVTKYYALAVTGPLMEQWKRELEERGVELLEQVDNNLYKAKTSNPALLGEMDFISAYRPYSIADKNLVVQKSISRDLDPFALPVNVPRLYDVRLQKDADVNQFMDFLVSHSITVIVKSDLKIRVLLSSEAQVILLGQQEGVYGIEEYVKPVLHNDLARKSLHIDVPEGDAYIDDLNLTGAGEIVGIADTGIDTAHPDLNDRVLKASAWGRKDDFSDPNGHGTHVAGSIAGTGMASNGKVKGMAPGAQLFFQSVLDANGGIGGLPHDLHELFQEAYNAGVRIHNNSWGSATESEYRFNSMEVDEFVYQHKDMLLVISSGNEGTAFHPRNSSPGFIDWLSLGSPATAKNALTVGASRSSRKKGGFSTLTYGQTWPDKYPEDPIFNEMVSGDAESMAGFSSRGPCGNESRIKPDVVAPGTDIASAKSSLAPTSNFWGPYPKNRNYAIMGGTSMGAPIVTGFAALIREYLSTKRQCDSPSAALLKAIIINGTRKLTGADSLADHDQIPNFHQGFGCVDMLNLLPSKNKEKLKLYFLDTWKKPELQFTVTGQRFLFRFKLYEGLPLRVCLTWTDPPGRGLQNNLNLLLMQVNGNLRWVGNEDLPRQITTFDRDNNVEIIRVEDPHEGEYRLVVQANNLLVAGQDFAVALSGNIENELEQLI